MSTTIPEIPLDNAFTAGVYVNPHLGTIFCVVEHLLEGFLSFDVRRGLAQVRCPDLSKVGRRRKCDGLVKFGAERFEAVFFDSSVRQCRTQHPETSGRIQLRFVSL